MINDVLDFMSRRSIESMLEDKTDKVEIQFTANTNNNSIDLKINQKYPYSMKVKAIGNVLSKQNLGYLMDTPISFTSTVYPKINSSEFDEVWKSGGTLDVSIEPESSYAEKFLNAYSKKNVHITIPAKEIPRIDN